MADFSTIGIFTVIIISHSPPFVNISRSFPWNIGVFSYESRFAITILLKKEKYKMTSIDRNGICPKCRIVVRLNCQQGNTHYYGYCPQCGNKIIKIIPKK